MIPRAVLFDLDDTPLDRAATIDGFLPGHYQRCIAPHVPYPIWCVLEKEILLALWTMTAGRMRASSRRSRPCRPQR